MRTRVGTRAKIEEFFGQKRMAVLGVSRDEKDYSRAVFRELKGRGYDVVPVNPSAAEVEGARCFPRLAEVAPGVDAALVLLPAAGAADALRECAATGVKRVWLRNDAPGAAEMSRQAGIELVAGYCPFMFMPNTQFAHKCHAFGLKLVGKYPRD